MGKKKRDKTRAKQKKSVPPDEYFSHGPIEIARFGTSNVIRSNMSNEQFEETQARLVERFPQVCGEIDSKISQIVEIVKKFPPDKLLQRAYWEMAAKHIGIESEIDLDQEAVVSLRMVEYIQSVIASVRPAKITLGDLNEEDWQELRSLVGDLFSQLNQEYQICHAAVRRKDDSHYDKDFEEYYFKAQIYWCNIRGNRYLFHQIPFFRDVLLPHNDILEKLFGIKVEDLLEALQKIQNSLTLGISEIMEDLHRFQQVSTTKLEEKLEKLEIFTKEDIPEIMAQVVQENGWEDCRDDISGKFLGLDLFDLGKLTNLPTKLLDELSWSPGQDTDFFAEGYYKGWPLRIWPIFKRPFIKLNDHHYCFALYSLFDNFYRHIQRVIIQQKEDYRTTWNEKQKDLSERLPIDLFEKILPGAQIYQSIYYRWHIGGSSKKQWCEVDSLLVYEDHLFIIEVKAGAFTYTSPATDFSAYIDSLRNLVFQPAEQGRRFLEYLESENQVKLFDAAHNEVGKISRKDFEHVQICGITLDPFTELAARGKHLKKIGIDIGERPVWSISIDDLRIYADIFDNPLIFLHFVEERMRASQSDLIDTDDELDHLGLYLKHNIYTLYASDLNLGGPMSWHGYRSKVDKYFTEKLHDANAVCPLKQNLPTHLKSIIDFLAASNKSHRRKASSMLLNCGGEWRSRIASGINEALDKQFELGRVQPLSIHGETKITLFCWQRGLLERDREFALEHSRAIMLMSQDKERLLLELVFDPSKILVDVDYTFLSLGGIFAKDYERLEVIADSLRKGRFGKAKRLHGKINRNDPCLCGSGKKYKKCCLNRP